MTVQYVDVAPRTSAIAYRPQVFLVRSRVPIAFLVPTPSVSSSTAKTTPDG